MTEEEMTSLAMQCSLDDMIDVAQESRLPRATAAAAASVTPGSPLALRRTSSVKTCALASPTGFIEDEQEEDDQEQDDDAVSLRSRFGRPLKKRKYFE